MRALLLKDLQVLRRSPLLTALLVIYPIVLAVLIGLAISRDSEKPSVAFFNEIPPGEGLQIGSGESGFDQEQAFAELCDRVKCVTVHSRDEVIEKVRDGEVLAGLIIPEDFIDKLQAQLNGAGLESAPVEVYVIEDDALKAELVDDRISALLTEANLILSQRISEGLLEYLDLLVEGGHIDLPLIGEARHPRAEADRGGAEVGAAPARPGAAAGDRPGDQLLRARPGQPRLRGADPLLRGGADLGGEGGGGRRGGAARHLRDRGRDRHHPDVRHRAAGRRVARAGARGEHLHPAHPGPRWPHGPAGREDRPRDDLLVRGDACSCWACSSCSSRSSGAGPT